MPALAKTGHHTTSRRSDDANSPRTGLRGMRLSSGQGCRNRYTRVCGNRHDRSTKQNRTHSVLRVRQNLSVQKNEQKLQQNALVQNTTHAEARTHVVKCERLDSTQRLGRDSTSHQARLIVCFGVHFKSVTRPRVSRNIITAVGDMSVVRTRGRQSAAQLYIESAGPGVLGSYILGSQDLVSWTRASNCALYYIVVPAGPGVLDGRSEEALNIPYGRQHGTHKPSGGYGGRSSHVNEGGEGGWRICYVRQ